MQNIMNVTCASAIHEPPAGGATTTRLSTGIRGLGSDLPEETSGGEGLESVAERHRIGGLETQGCTPFQHGLMIYPLTHSLDLSIQPC